MDDLNDYGDDLDSCTVPNLVRQQSSAHQTGLDVFDLNFAKPVIDEACKTTKVEDRVTGLTKIESAEQEMIQLGTIITLLVKNLKFLNKENESAINRPVYTAMYNVLMTILGNVDFRAIKTNEKDNVIDNLNELAAEILEGPFENHFSSLYLLEQGAELSAATMGEVYDEFQGTDDNMKFTFFDSCQKKKSGNVVAVIDLKALGFKQVEPSVTETVLKRQELATIRE